MYVIINIVSQNGIRAKAMELEARNALDASEIKQDGNSIGFGTDAYRKMYKVKMADFFGVEVYPHEPPFLESELGQTKIYIVPANGDLLTTLKKIAAGDTGGGGTTNGGGGGTTNGDGFLCRFLPKSMQKYCTGESGMFTKIKFITFAVGGIIIYKMIEKK